VPFNPQREAVKFITSNIIPNIEKYFKGFEKKENMFFDIFFVKKTLFNNLERVKSIQILFSS